MYFSFSRAREKGWAGRERAKRGESESEREREIWGLCLRVQVEFRCIFQVLFRRHWDADMALESARPTVSTRKFVLIINEVILGIVKKEYHK